MVVLIALVLFVQLFPANRSSALRLLSPYFPSEYPAFPLALLALNLLRRSVLDSFPALLPALNL